MTAHTRAVAPAVVVVLVAGALALGVVTAPAWAGQSPWWDERDRKALPLPWASRAAASQPDDASAVRLLHRAMTAPRQVSYSGTQYVSAWSALDRATSTSAVVEIEHTAGGPTVVDGRDAGRLSWPSAGGGNAWLANAGGPVALLVEAYDVAVVGSAEVAGRPVEVVEARRSDGSVAARLWLDSEHALPLRREVYDEQGRAVSASAFIEVDIVDAAPSQTPRLASPALSVGSAPPDGTPLSRGDLNRLRSEGWQCPDAIGGSLVLYHASRHGDTVHLSYSDGVATLSLFEQRGYLDPAALDGFRPREVDGGVVYSKPGPPSQLTWVTEGDRVITVVADGSVADVQSVLDALPPDPPEQPGGVLDRIARGAKRLASWLSPFGG